MFCKKCGAQIDDDSVFCAKCGANLGGTTVNVSSEVPSNIPTFVPTMVPPNVPYAEPVKEKGGKAIKIAIAICFFIILALIVVIVLLLWNPFKKSPATAKDVAKEFMEATIKADKSGMEKCCLPQILNYEEARLSWVIDNLSRVISEYLENGYKISYKLEDYERYENVEQFPYEDITTEVNINPNKIEELGIFNGTLSASIGEESQFRLCLIKYDNKWYIYYLDFGQGRAKVAEPAQAVEVEY